MCLILGVSIFNQAIGDNGEEENPGQVIAEHVRVGGCQMLRDILPCYEESAPAGIEIILDECPVIRKQRCISVISG